MKKILTCSISLYFFLSGNFSNAQEAKVQYSSVVKMTYNKVEEPVDILPEQVKDIAINKKLYSEKAIYILPLNNQREQPIPAQTINLNPGIASQSIVVNDNLGAEKFLLR